jgi:hypothetical protein
MLLIFFLYVDSCILIVGLVVFQCLRVPVNSAVCYVVCHRYVFLFPEQSC